MFEGGVGGSAPPRNLDVEALGTLVHYQRGAEISAGPDTGFCYRLESGAVRKFALFPDGRRQIVDFLFTGDHFNMRQRHRPSFTAEALVVPTIVMRFPFHRLERLAEGNPRVSAYLLQCAYASMGRSDSRTVLLGRVTAVEKVGSFIVAMAERMANTGDLVMLPMSRSDVADYLAISVETVSRAFTSLCRLGAITLEDVRGIRILSRLKLINPRGRN
jgi:CRP-like cAMP-binding protein